MRSLERRRLQCYLGLLCADAALLFAAFTVSSWFYLGLKGANIEGEVIDDAIVQLGARGARQAGGRGLLLVSLGPLHLRSRAVKRGFDVVVATAALVLLAPLLAAVAIAIVLEDRGPVLFVQRRMGRGNTFFSMYKFRSMAVARQDHDGTQSTMRDDHRVTRVGRLIRRSSIDELPQLINVLLGDMSIVGPRPHAIGSRAPAATIGLDHENDAISEAMWKC